MRIYKRICKISLNNKWLADWYYKKNEDRKSAILQDYTIRSIVKKELEKYIVCNIRISRLSKIKVHVFCSKNLHILNKNTNIVEQLKNKIEKTVGIKCSIEIIEQERPDCCAQHVAKHIAWLLEAREKSHLKKHFLFFASNAMREGAKGIYIAVKGRVNGAAIARSEKFYRGSVPKNILSFDVDYAQETAFTVSGTCGIKVYINK